MKFKLSKLYLALAAAGFGSAICVTTYAQTAQSNPIVAPTNQARFYGALTGLWATPTNDDLYYAMTGTRSDSGNRSFHNIDLDHDWGWRLDAGYLIPCTGNDISANWTYLSADEDCSTSGDVYSRFLPANKNVISLSPWDNVKSDVCFEFNEVNLEVGQKVDFCSLHTRFHFGLSYVCLEHDIDTTANGKSKGLRDRRRHTARSHLESDFWGVGPRLGIDITYPLGCSSSRFGLVGHMAGSLLAGEIEVKENASATTISTSTRSSTGSSSSSVSNFRTRSDDVCTVVPAAMLKIGLQYASQSDPGCGGYLIEAGYQASGYFHTINHSLDFDRAHRTGFINPISNFGIYGWYLTLGYAG